MALNDTGEQAKIPKLKKGQATVEFEKMTERNSQTLTNVLVFLLLSSLPLVLDRYF
jgi:hypothetical protein